MEDNVVTSISQAKRKPKNVHIYINNSYWVTIDKIHLSSNDIFKGKNLTDDEMDQIRNLSELDRIRDKLIGYVSIRPRSEYECYFYLAVKNDLDNENTKIIIDQFKELNYINDKSFSEWLVEMRLNTSKHGIQRIKSELFKKRVSPEIIREVIRKYSKTDSFKDEQIKKAIELCTKMYEKTNNKDPYKLKSNLINKLKYRGYSYEIIKIAISKVLNS